MRVKEKTPVVKGETPVQQRSPSPGSCCERGVKGGRRGRGERTRYGEAVGAGGCHQGGALQDLGRTEPWRDAEAVL